MKKALVTCIAVFGLGLAILIPKSGHTAAPQEQGAQLSGAFSHTTFFGSTVAVSGAASFNGGASNNALMSVKQATAGASYANCFTKFVIQIPTNTYVQVQDGTTATSSTTWTFGGLGLASSGMNTLTVNEDHLGPLCLTPGYDTFIFISTAAGQGLGAASSVLGIGVNYEGYTTAGAGSSKN